MHLVFWQPIPSFHQEGLLRALVAAKWVDSVELRYEEALPDARQKAGWADLEVPLLTARQIVRGERPEEEEGYVHIFTGLNTHPLVWAAFHRLSKGAKCRAWAYAEAPDLSGCSGLLRRLKFRFLAKRVSARLEGMLALGELGKNFYRERLPASVPVHSFAYYSFNQRELCETSPRDEPNSTFRFLYVGQLIRRKGLHRLFGALSKVAHLDWSLAVVGQGPEASKLRRIAEDQGFADKIEWLGVRPQAELFTHYSKADAVILPSVWDGWGMTVNEALRYGVQVFASSTCGAASSLPSEMQLPVRVRNWAPFFESKILQGPLTLTDRAAYQKLAISLTGEAGAERLRQILTS